MLFAVQSLSKNPYVNLAYEQYLLRVHEKSTDDVYLYFYENIDSVILGKTLQIDQEVYTEKNFTLPLLRRESGGGTVLHFNGNMNFAVLLSLEKFPQMFAIQESYCSILKVVTQALEDSLRASLAGISDVCITQSDGALKKISGNAQVRKNKWLLHHGTIVYRADNLRKISYYLRQPPKQPEYRQQRSHRDFVAQRFPKLNPAKLRYRLAHGYAESLGQNLRWQTIDPLRNILQTRNIDFFRQQIAAMKLR